MLPKRLRKPINSLAIVVFTTILGVLIQLIPSVKDRLKNVADQFGLSYGKFWLLLVGIAGLVLTVLTYRNERNQGSEPKELAASERDSIRDNIIETLGRSYENRLAQKLDKRIALKLAPRYTKEGTSEEYAEVYFAQDAIDEKEIRSTLSAVLQKHLFLLIIGKPGVGKTTLLLDLAIVFLGQAKNDRSLPYPVIFNLASWREGKDVNDWMADVLVEGNGFTRQLAHDVIERKEILPLLDGFDEIADKDLRGDCLNKIQRFLPKYEPKKLVICSRINEYKEIIVDAPIRAEVLLKELSESQVRRRLKEIIDNPRKESSRPFANTTAARHMLHLMDCDASLADVLRNPFYFNLATQVFYTSEIDKQIPKPAPRTEHDWQHYLVEEFVNDKLQIKSANFPSAKKTKRYLIWLAAVLKYNKVGSFELSFFQPTILRRPRVSSVLHGSLIGLIVGTVFGWIYGVFFSLSYGIRHNYVITEDIRRWKWSGLGSLKSWKRISRALLSSVLYCALFFGIIGVALFDFVSGLTFGLVSGMIVGFMSGVIRETSEIVYFSKIQKPYQRLRKGIVFHMLMWASINGIGNALIFRNNLSAKYDVLLICVLYGGAFGFMLTPFFKHLILRVCFYLEGAMPLRYVDFLNYATEELRILERDGGQWQFRHEILEDYFASLYFKK